MFLARRIIPNKKLFTNLICTSNVLNCDEPKDGIERKEKIAASSQEKINDVKSTSRSLKHKGQKKTYLGISKSSVENVAKEFSGIDTKKTTADIFNYLKEMEVSKEPLNRQFPKDDYVAVKPVSRTQIGKPFYSSSPVSFNIESTEPQVKLKIWEDLEAEELKFLGKKSPSNYFEELISWTEEGKLWHFPIDNDQGMEKEAEISFTEHIFMDKYLEPWCPKRGPLRKFMELVLIGLSKNHTYTLEEKKAHIDWFRKYFEEKKKLLQELGAMGSSRIEASAAEEKP